MWGEDVFEGANSRIKGNGLKTDKTDKFCYLENTGIIALISEICQSITMTTRTSQSKH